MSFNFDTQKLRRLIDRKEVAVAELLILSDRVRNARQLVRELEPDLGPINMGGWFQERDTENSQFKKALAEHEAAKAELGRLMEEHERRSAELNNLIGLANECESWAREQGWRPVGAPTGVNVLPRVG